MKEITKNGSYVQNCHIKFREDNKVKIFDRSPDRNSIIVRLDGYAIIPLEEYEQLKKLREMSLELCRGMLGLESPKV